MPQVYLGAPGQIPDGVQFPVRALVGFRSRAPRRQARRRPLPFTLPERQLQYWSTKDGKWVLASGKRTVSVGGSSRDLRLNQAIE